MSFFYLPVPSQIHPLQQTFFRPFFDIPLRSGKRHVEPGGDFNEGLAVEFIRQGVQEELAADGGDDFVSKECTRQGDGGENGFG